MITIAGIPYEMFWASIYNPHTTIRMHKAGIFMDIPIIISRCMCQSQTKGLARCFRIATWGMLMIEPDSITAAATGCITRMIMICILYFSWYLLYSDYYFLRNCKNCLLHIGKGCILGNCNIFCEQRSRQQFFTVTHRLKNRL